MGVSAKNHAKKSSVAEDAPIQQSEDLVDNIQKVGTPPAPLADYRGALRNHDSDAETLVQLRERKADLEAQLARAELDEQTAKSKAEATWDAELDDLEKRVKALHRRLASVNAHLKVGESEHNSADAQILAKLTVFWRQWVAAVFERQNSRVLSEYAGLDQLTRERTVILLRSSW
jgi:chromosome segregation ATPase